MALRGTRESMARKILPPEDDDENVDIIIEEHQWNTTTSKFTWRHGLILALILGGAILFAFGFLIIAGLVLMAVILINIVSFIIKKLT